MGGQSIQDGDTIRSRSQVDVEGARMRCFDLVSRDEAHDVLLFAVERAAREAVLRRELSTLRARVSDAAASAMIGRSNAMTHVRELIGRAAASRASVSITGEAGTGKDLVARLVHDLSDRAGRPFVTISCTDANDDALATELFGDNARTNGHGRRGLFGDAHGGTLVLNESSAMSPGLRSMIARVPVERMLAL